METWFEQQRQKLGIHVIETDREYIKDWVIADDIRHKSGKYHRSVFLKAWDNVRNGWVDRFLIAPVLNNDNLYGVALLARRGDYYLVQAKAEPGNNTPNYVQLTSTIHASYENIKSKLSGAIPFTWMYGDERCVKYVVSQDGAQLYLKNNLVCFLELNDDVEIPDNFFWASLKEIKGFAKQGLVSEHLMQCLGASL